jgi:hypothetical protein
MTLKLSVNLKKLIVFFFSINYSYLDKVEFTFV